MNMINVKQIRDFPAEPIFAFPANSIEAVKRWAEERKAETVWVYRHSSSKSEQYTAAILVNADVVRKVICAVGAL